MEALGFLLDKQIWWASANNVRIPIGILVALVLGFRFYSIYQSTKKTNRPPKVRRIENIVAIGLWSFIAVSVVLLLIFKR